MRRRAGVKKRAANQRLSETSQTEFEVITEPKEEVTRAKLIHSFNIALGNVFAELEFLEIDEEKRERIKRDAEMGWECFKKMEKSQEKSTQPEWNLEDSQRDVEMWSGT